MSRLKRKTQEARASGALERPRHGHVLGISKQSFHRIAYTEWGPADAERVAICVHGLSRQGRDFDRLAARLAGGGYRVICPDLVGRGRSEWLADPDEYGLPQYCMDMTVLLARLGVAEVDWIGTSLGGLIGIVMAALPGTPVRRLVINDIGPYLAWPALYRIGSYLRATPKEFENFETATAYFREILTPFGKLDDEEWQHLTEHSIEHVGDELCRMLCDPGIARAFRPGLLYNLNLWSYWDAITCPTLVLRGEHSDLLQANTADEMSRRGPRAKLVEIADVGHAPPLLNREQIGLITDWLGV